MRTNINLSSQPFANRRLFWLIWAAVCLATLIALLRISSEKSLVIAEANGLEQDVRIRQLQLAKIKEERQRTEQQTKVVVLTHTDKLQLAAARQLIQSKSFSWNKLVSDIERFVPNNTRIESLNLEELFSQEEGVAANIEIRAFGKDTAQLPDMMTRLTESGGLFTVGKTNQDQMDQSGDVPFSIFVTYRPFRGMTQ